MALVVAGGCPGPAEPGGAQPGSTGSSTGAVAASTGPAVAETTASPLEPATTDTGEGSSSSSGEPSALPSPAQYDDVTGEAGINSPHEVVLGHHAIGQAWGDYDRDGWLDLYLTGGAEPSVLYHNEGDGSFAVAAASPDVALADGATAGAAWGDYDNDGWLDLYVSAKGRNTLLHSEAGLAFTDVTEAAGVGDEGHGAMATWGDFDGDGWLDLYVANHGLSVDRLYRNAGDGSFAPASVLLEGAGQSKAAFAATFLDFDDDGDLDLSVINDHLHGNELHRNDGPGCGGWCLTRVSGPSGAGLSINGMGQAVGDFDNDLDLDLYLSDIHTAHLLRSRVAQGEPTFEQVAAAQGVDFPALGWGTVFLDFDNDGWLDLYLATQNEEPALCNRLFRNRGNGTFLDVTAGSGADDTRFSYGVGYADYDHDGLVDLVVGNRGSGYRLLRNTGARGSDHHWVTLKLRGGGPINRDAIGARVTITTSAGEQRMAEVRSGSTMGGGNSMRLHFGLGTTTLERVSIRWPDGRVDVREGLPTDEVLELDYPVR